MVLELWWGLWSEGCTSFGNFCCNGLVNAVREPHPHLIEVKKEYQYIKSALTDPKKLTVEVKNWYDFTNLNAYTFALGRSWGG